MPRRPIVAILGVLGALILFAIVGGAYLFFQWWDWYPAAAQLPAAEKRARELGLPMTAADIAPNPPVKPEENAAEPLRQLAAEMRKIKGVREEVRSLERAMGEGRADDARRMLEKFDRAIQAAEAIGARPGLDMGRDWDLGTGLLFPEWASVKDISKVLDARARLQKGVPETAIRNVRLQNRLARLVGSEPNLISMLVHIAVRRISLGTVERLAGEWKNDDAKLALLERELTGRGPLPDFVHALRGEIYTGVATIRNLDLYDKKKKIDPRRLRRQGMPKSLHLRAYMARHLQTWNRAWPLVRSHQDDPLGATEGLRSLEEDVQTQKGASYLLLAMLYPVFDQSGLAIVTLDANERATLSL
ncbi:MAG TPA: hypothetical protein VGE01_11000, partial [Fimbriimonas sp.]